MANRHFAEIGDVWKHLPLAEVLALLDVRTYWESHSGSASYPLEPSAARNYGAIRFQARASGSPELARSGYASLLATCSARGRYPGSPLVALAGAPGAEFLFCDTDSASLESIRAEADALGVPPARVRTELADGLSTLDAALGATGRSSAETRLVFIDPYRPLEPGPSGRHALDVFRRSADLGTPTMLWYGFGRLEWREVFMREVRAGDARGDLWWAEVTPEFLHRGIEDTTGCHIGAGILCANLGERTVAACRGLGCALAGIYTDATLADGTPAALLFAEGSGR